MLVGYGFERRSQDEWLIHDTGPAHAVYFGTYEAVKEFAGGNKDDLHHPFAAGIWGLRYTGPVRGCILLTSYQLLVGHAQRYLVMLS